MSTPFTARDPTFEARVRASFARQAFMETLGARIEHVRPGDVLLSLPFSDALTQQHGFLHAGAATSVIDSACGYAADVALPAVTRHFNITTAMKLPLIS
jgi:acyl-coenzyme A thioesterase PaaI-like protein